MTAPVIASNVALDGLNTLRLKARAARYCKITSASELKTLFHSDQWGAGPALVLGGGSNLVLSGDIDGLVLHIAIAGLHIDDSDPETVKVHAGAGENWDAVVRHTLAQGHGGLENLIAIPGNCGAAPVQNIGAYGLELSERIAAVEVFDRSSGEFARLDAAACAFGYRDSFFKRNPARFIITAVELALHKPWVPVLGYRELQAMHPACTTPGQIAAAVAALRAGKLPDPAVVGNVGSFFKNPIVSSAQLELLNSAFPGVVAYPQADGSAKLAAGWLIEHAGLKGASRGDASVDQRQALVLINRGAATAADVLDLAEHVRQVVMARYGVLLEREPVLV